MMKRARHFVFLFAAFSAITSFSVLLVYMPYLNNIHVLLSDSLTDTEEEDFSQASQTVSEEEDIHFIISPFNMPGGYDSPFLLHRQYYVLVDSNRPDSPSEPPEQFS